MGREAQFAIHNNTGKLTLVMGTPVKAIRKSSYIILQIAAEIFYKLKPNHISYLKLRLQSGDVGKALHPALAQVKSYSNCSIFLRQRLQARTAK